MKTMIVSAVVLGGLVLGIQNIRAHEGHDQTPGSVNAPHGGSIQGTNQLYWELVKDATGVKLYPLTHELSPIAPKDVQMSGTIQFPKKTKKEPVKFSPADDHFAAQVDAKGAYRYTLELAFTYKGKKEKVKFQVEPQG